MNGSQSGNEIENGDSRKRPIERDVDAGLTKRSNADDQDLNLQLPYHLLESSGTEPPDMQCSAGDNVHFKVLVPSIAAGAIIGKGGEAIAQIQKETGAKVKMSKANDFYPGTTERVCLVLGNVESILAVHNYIMEKILEKPDPNPKPSGDGRLNVERHKQVKILVPNSTAGMIIGKGGAYINEIKTKSGSYVQISQKSKELNLTERCVTIAASTAAGVSGELDQNKNAVQLILQKIAEDPQSASCPNISYSDVSGPVASAHPTGSPFAVAPAGSASTTTVHTHTGSSQGAPVGHASSTSTLQASSISLSSSLSSSGGFATLSMENLRNTLRQSGYSEAAIDEITTAMYTLANYGFLNINALGMLPPGLTTPATPVPAMVPSPQASFNLSTGSLLGTATSVDASSGALASGPPAEFGGFNDQPPAFTLYQPTMSYTDYSAGAQASAPSTQQGFEEKGMAKKELDVPESLVGVILGPGGKEIVELQQATQTNIQISKKGVYLPGTRNRVVSITGSHVNVLKAASMIQQRVQQEEARRQQTGQQPTPVGMGPGQMFPPQKMPPHLG